MTDSHCKRLFPGFLLLVLTTFIFAQTPTTPTAPPDLDAYVASSMKTFDVPGMAVAIVKDGKILVAKGYGLRKLGDPTPVDEFTMFAIGSNTKAFTTAPGWAGASRLPP